MKSSFCFDTAALVSLGHTDILPLIIDNFYVIISKGVLEELKDIARHGDDDSRSAKKWLDYQREFEIRNIPRKRHAEDELFEICKSEDHLFVSDDIIAIKQFKSDNVKCYYSVHIIFLLYYKEKISKERALLNIEKMRTKRDWKTNLITIAARTLFN